MKALKILAKPAPTQYCSVKSRGEAFGRQFMTQTLDFMLRMLMPTARTRVRPYRVKFA
ncbi:MAG: hypothetical protein U7127_06070 [Phormidium sp.]